MLRQGRPRLLALPPAAMAQCTAAAAAHSPPAASPLLFCSAHHQRLDGNFNCQARAWFAAIAIGGSVADAIARPIFIFGDIFQDPGKCSTYTRVKSPPNLTESKSRASQFQSSFHDFTPPFGSRAPSESRDPSEFGSWSALDSWLLLTQNFGS